jgi:hypothetical protein
MQARTQFRLATLANGYTPLLNNCKKAIEEGWPKQVVDEAVVRSWDRSILASTGMRIDGDLAVIDVDVTDAGLVAALAGELGARFPALFERGLVRHTGGPKEAWFARVDVPFRRLASRRWHRGGDPKDPATPKHMVECFGSRGARQFGIDGPHTRIAGKAISIYQFTGGASPATVPRALLPVLPKAAYAAACDLFDGIAAAAGLTAIKEARGGGEGAGVVYDLTDDMLFENESGSWRLDELHAEYLAAQHEGRDFRVTSSFLEDGGVNPTKCIVGYSKRSHCIYVHDFETGLTHMPANRASSALFGFLEQYKRFGQ